MTEEVTEFLATLNKQTAFSHQAIITATREQFPKNTLTNTDFRNIRAAALKENRRGYTNPQAFIKSIEKDFPEVYYNDVE